MVTVSSSIKLTVVSTVDTLIVDATAKEAIALLAAYAVQVAAAAPAWWAGLYAPDWREQILPGGGSV
jgi:hypothetical protein